MLDKILTRTRYSLLIVSVFGIVFSLTEASFTGQSVISSSLGLKFSNPDGFKLAYLLVLIYVSYRYIVHYFDLFEVIMARTIERNINKGMCAYILSGFMRSIESKNENKKEKKFYSEKYSYRGRDRKKRNINKVASIILDFDENGISTHEINFDFNTSNFLCKISVSFHKSEYSLSGLKHNKYVCFFKGNFGDDIADNEMILYSAYVNRYSRLGVLLMMASLIAFIRESLSRKVNFEFCFPLYFALVAFILSIKYFFFSSKTIIVVGYFSQSIV